MSQHDFDIVNQTASSARDDINNALQALASNNSLGTEPTTPYEKMWWYDTSNNILKSYKGSGTWINVGRFNQSTNKFEILDDTKVVTTSGDEVGILGDQLISTWETGTGTTESLVSPAKVKAAANAVANAVAIGVGQTWQNVLGSRAIGTSYQNTTGKPIFVSVSGYGTSGGVPMAQVSVDGSTWISVVWRSNTSVNTASFVVPDNSYYRIVNLSVVSGGWAELR